MGSLWEKRMSTRTKSYQCKLVIRVVLSNSVDFGVVIKPMRRENSKDEFWVCDLLFILTSHNYLLNSELGRYTWLPMNKLNISYSLSKGLLQDWSGFSTSNMTGNCSIDGIKVLFLLKGSCGVPVSLMQDVSKCAPGAGRISRTREFARNRNLGTHLLT